MSSLPAQDFLFQHIKQVSHEGASLADVISEILYLSSDSVYRRIRGETPLTLDETKTLCEHFKISLDQLLKLDNDFVLFRDHRVNVTTYTFENYLEGLGSQVNFISSFREKEVIYLTKDIPLFHSFCYKALFAFRYFFWMKSIICHPQFVNATFSLNCLPAHIEEAGLRLCKAYNQLPTVEIWNTECVNGIIAQVEFYYEAGYIRTTEEVNAIYNSIIDALEHLRLQAEAGVKFIRGENAENKPANLRLFHNKTVLGDNTIFVKCGAIKSVFINYDVLNYMHTSDEKFCGQMSDMFSGLMRRSTLISRENEKQRLRFFNILRTRVSARKRNT
ncbi:MAG TPA: helix-turn-helix domain-containing protein [Panacibacter sp.]|nr:helix-turn-helix domain-containing protein [Panacibacter sp.]HNP45696.1 helix-turn-helix domain-containing protein [Panacibacter sp.]